VRLLAAVCVGLALLGIAPAIAETKLSGTFIAKQACAALQSIKKQTNPGNISLVPGASYKLLAGNTDQPTHYWIVVPTAQPDYRWVPVSCGTVTLDQGTATPAAPTPAPPPVTTATPAPPSTGKAEYVLAISWEPAFCEGVSRATECRTQTAASYEATHFSLHGLWPQPRNVAYCNVSDTDRNADKAHRWSDLPPVDLSSQTHADLAEVMPGLQSGLERHEWIEHGTCSGASQETYFKRAALFTGTINNGSLPKLFADNIGKRLDGTAIRRAFETDYGTGAGDRIRIACDTDGNRRIITEITIGLRGDVMGTGGLGELIAASSRTDPGCNGGIVDPAGLQ
jgi:ribonuclease T2